MCPSKSLLHSQYPNLGQYLWRVWETTGPNSGGVPVWWKSRTAAYRSKISWNVEKDPQMEAKY